MWAVQFHPEVHHTPQGTEILRNFVCRFAVPSPRGLRNTSSMRPCQRAQTVGNGRAICALSGGVDSAVAATLVDRALRDPDGNPD